MSAKSYNTYIALKEELTIVDNKLKELQTEEETSNSEIVKLDTTKDYLTNRVDLLYLEVKHMIAGAN